MKNSLPNFDSKQREFTAYIRDPEHNPVPEGVQPPRMAMYRELFFNNINGFLSSNFPVLRTLLNDAQWFALAQDFFANHASQSPYFSEIPEEFLAFLEHERDNANDYPFMLELAHYEWVEMALAISKEELVIHDAKLTLESRVQLSPLAWSLAYQYPVHKISPDFLPTTPPEQPTCLIVYRDAHDDVHFMEITPLTYRLLAMIEEQESMIVADCLQQLIQETQHPNPELMRTAGLQILVELAEKMIVVLG
ncbi:MAG: DUF2063 domain-containing protein [Methylococcales bacterium]|nr:DUF2063 domain-containing protein [Methylococcales bacterium]